MKRKLILLMATLTVLEAKAVQVVDNSLESVENQVINVNNKYQNEIICEGVMNNENYILKINWNKLFMHEPDGRAPLIKSEFKFVLKNLNQNKVIEDSYAHFFGERSLIKESESTITFSGHFHMFKRLGQIFKNTEIEINKINENESLISFVNSYTETFTNPRDWCNPPSKLCGLEPIGVNPEDMVKTEIIMEKAACVKTKK